MLRPKSEQLMQVKEIIVASFYSPPKSRKKSKLLDHILTTLHVLLTKYPRAGIIIGADRNDLNISSLLVGLPRVRQIVTEYTYQRKIHDIIITNLHQFYLTPIVVPPVAPDDPQRGVPSDHSVPIATPMSSNSQCQSKQYRTIQFRPLPQEGIEHFGDWLKTESWNCLNGEMPPTEQVKVMETKFVEKLEKCLPQKQLKISSHEKPWINFEIKYLDRRKKREYPNMAALKNI